MHLLFAGILIAGTAFPAEAAGPIKDQPTGLMSSNNIYPVAFPKDGTDLITVRTYTEADGNVFDIYDQDLKLVKGNIPRNDENGSIEYIYFMNIDATPEFSNDAKPEFFFSQRLFNDDDDFEYIKSYEGEDDSDDGRIVIQQLNSGKVLATITIPQDYGSVVSDMYVCSFARSGKKYLIVESSKGGYGSEETNYFLWYEITPDFGGVLAPKMVTQSSNIVPLIKDGKVEIACGKDAVVTVANPSGITELRIESGYDNAISFPTSALANGVHLFLVWTSKGQKASGKFVISE